MSRIVKCSLVVSIGVYILCVYTKYSLAKEDARTCAHARGLAANTGGAA